MSGLREKLLRRGKSLGEKPSLNDLFECLPGELRNEIVRVMGARDRVQFLRSTKSFKKLVEPCHNILYNIDGFLSKFFNPRNTLTFLRVQTRTQAIIGGSSGQEFFDHKESLGPLKLYVVGWRSSLLTQFLPTTGYVASEDQPPFKLESVSQVTIYTQAGRPDIQVHLTKFGILLPILEQPFSCLMAFMTSTEAIHLFPNSALQHREAVVNSRGGKDDCYDAIVQRLEKDGYTTYNQPSDRERYRGLPEADWTYENTYYSEFRYRRRVGDNRTLVVELGDDGLLHLNSLLDTMDSLVRRNSWAHDEEPAPIGFIQRGQPPVLEWSYIVGRYCRSNDILVQHGLSGHTGGNFCVEFDDPEEEDLSLQNPPTISAPCPTCAQGYDSENEYWCTEDEERT
ncbi:hypothetical protein V5O48_004001 [Marasmius crinis-equi]|uniref:F-box domain-containing protein n=1 Tax=Marasmius crinis-equi TaxID=585013 RepID=A0ABR3FS43_9AGAR